MDHWSERQQQHSRIDQKACVIMKKLARYWACHSTSELRVCMIVCHTWLLFQAHLRLFLCNSEASLFLIAVCSLSWTYATFHASSFRSLLCICENNAPNLKMMVKCLKGCSIIDHFSGCFLNKCGVLSQIRLGLNIFKRSWSVCHSNVTVEIANEKRLWLILQPVIDKPGRVLHSLKTTPRFSHLHSLKKILSNESGMRSKERTSCERTGNYSWKLPLINHNLTQMWTQCKVFSRKSSIYVQRDCYNDNHSKTFSWWDRRELVRRKMIPNFQFWLGRSMKMNSHWDWYVI